MSLTPFHRQFANHLQGVRALTTFLPCLILIECDHSDVAGQGHLTPFSTGELMAYKIKFYTVQLNSTFHIDSPILMLLTIIYSSVFHITSVSKHVIVA